MLARNIYYYIKPLLSRRVRFALRRMWAGRTREQKKATWPIDERAAKPPERWPGWPDQKRFAFLLTHDVEGPEGLAKCRQLAELEMSLGFRSSFNFIPEGSYRVPPELRAWLIGNGFEVGVHDLHHNGKLFLSKKQFMEKATRINRYLQQWGAAGFRAGFMLRNLDWMQKLDVIYDASTFDTDPFEPQPDSAGTIFPFWVTPSPEAAAAGHRGYVELPYSLPQDSTLFLLLRESTPEIWLRKLDWVAARGGMALVNVHPDYLRFDGERSSPHTFSVEKYAALLRHVSEKHAQQVWSPLPHQLARWFKAAYHKEALPPVPVPATVVDRTRTAPSKPAILCGKRAAVLLYSTYPSDPRPRRAAEAMIEAGMEVDLLCLSEYESDLPEETVRGVRVFRLPMKRQRGSKWNYVWLYGRFLLSGFWFLLRHGTRRRYDLVHVHNMPDFLVFSTLLSKLRGARVILDLHDPMPELMMTIYGLGEKRKAVSLLKFMEKMSIGVSNAVLTVNEACRKIFIARSCRAEKVRVVMNSPDENIFVYQDILDRPKPLERDESRQFVIMYHGSIVERHGLDQAVSAVARVKPLIPNVVLRIYGHETPYLKQVMSLAGELHLNDTVQFLGAKTLEQIVVAIKECDVGIIPNRRSIFTEINTPTRIFEYLSQAKPVIAPRAPGITDYFRPDELNYFEMGSVDDLADQIMKIYRQPGAAADVVRRGQAVFREHAWHKERQRLIDLIADVLGGPKREKSLTAAAVPLSETGP